MNQGASKMALKYRGITYESAPNSVGLTQRNKLAKYRGIHYHLGQQFLTQNPPSVPLKYRGINY